MEINDFRTFLEWMLPNPQQQDPGALVLFVLTAFSLFVLGLFIGWMLLAVRHGPSEAFYRVAATVADGVTDTLRFSPRRVLAMARLAILEAWRRRVVVVFFVFVVLLMFASWFLHVQNDDPAKLYISFVLNATNYLVLMLGLFLSAFSLPSDIKNRTIYTISTKPVRPNEIILGRVLGFSVVGAALLMLMWLASYLFVVRGLAHEHVLSADGVQEMRSSDGKLLGYKGETSFAGRHRHTFQVGVSGEGVTDIAMGHRHGVRKTDDGFQFTRPNSLQARRPLYGRLRFLGREGTDAKSGGSVGDEWKYRSYIEGGTKSAAIWKFQGVTESRFPDGFSLELTLLVFRTFKGDIVSGIPGQIVLKNPDPDKNVRTGPISFRVREFETDRKRINRKVKIQKENGQEVEQDLFESVVNEQGEVEVWIQCLENAQYFGMARADVYISSGTGPPFVNFMKAYLGIWLQFVVVVSMGMMFSTFLNGPITMLASFGAMIVAFFSHFIGDVWAGKQKGGGPIESFVRMVRHMNVQLDLEGATGSVIQFIDKVVYFPMRGIGNVLPNYDDFNTIQLIANGFDIPWDLVARHGAMAAAYALGALVVGYFFLKTREVAA